MERSIVRTKKVMLVVTLICVFSSLCLIASFSHVLGSQGVAPSDWPMFHYDLSHDGYTTESTGPMTNNVLWTHPLNGFVTSAPVVSGGVVYIGLGDGLYAFNAYTGSQIWRYQNTAENPADPAFYQCCVSGGVVYAGSYDGQLYALNANTGAKIWSYQTSGGAGYESQYAGDVSQAPCVVGSVVYFAADNGYAYALNTANGNQIWSSQVPGSYVSGGIYTVYAPSSPTVVGGVLYIGSAGGALDAFDASSGTELWSYSTSGAQGVTSTPAVVGGVVYFGSSDSKVYALAAGTTSSTGTSLAWSYTTGGAVRSSPAVANGVVYIGSTDGKLYALNANTGAKIWSYQTPMNPTNPGVYNWVDSSPAVANGVVYFGSENYDVYALNAASGALIWSYQTPYVEPSCPAIASGVLYIGGYGVFAFDGVSASISPSSSRVMDVGQSQTFTLSASGGSGSLSYEWYVNGADTGQTGSTYTFNAVTSNVGTDNIYAVATDGLGVTGQSNTATVTVNAAPSATVSPSSSAVDWRDGHQITYTVTPSGGSGKLSYQWYQDNSQIDGQTSTTYLSYASYNSVGSHTVYCTVTDSATTPVTANSNTADFTVNPQLSVTVSPSSATTPSSVTVDPGQSATFTATPSGGSGAYTYQWYVDSSAQGTVTSSNTLSYSTTTPGQHNVWVGVYDGISTASFYSTANLNVNYPPSATISPSYANIDVGQQQQFSISSMTGGEWPFTYEWYVNGVDTGQSGYTFTYTAQASDVSSPPTITVVPTDSFGLAGDSNSVTLTVYPALSVSITPASWTMNVRQLQTFLASSSGGTGTTTYEWWVNGVDSGMSGATFDYTAQPSDVNSPPSIYAVATDTANGQATSNTVAVTVNPAENVGSTAGASAPVTSGSVTVDQSASTGVSATVTGTSLQNGETLDVNSAYYGSNQPSGTGAVSVGGAVFFDVAVSQAGGAALGSDVTVTVSFTDPSITSSSVIQYWDSASSSWVQVVTTFAAPDTVSGSIPADDLTGTTIAVGYSSNVPSVTVSPSTWTMDVGQAQTFTATAFGGSGSYTGYQWYVNGAAQNGQTASTFNYSSGSAGSYSITATVTDSSSTTSAQSTATTVTVNAAPTVSIAPAGSLSLNVGQVQAFTATVSGGSGSISYQWYLDGAAVGSNSASYSYTAAGTSHTVTCQVTDSASAPVTSPVSNVVSVTVSSAIPESPELLLGIALVFSTIIALSGLSLKRRKQPCKIQGVLIRKNQHGKQ